MGFGRALLRAYSCNKVKLQVSEGNSSGNNPTLTSFMQRLEALKNQNGAEGGDEGEDDPEDEKTAEAV